MNNFLRNVFVIVILFVGTPLMALNINSEDTSPLYNIMQNSREPHIIPRYSIKQYDDAIRQLYSDHGNELDINDRISTFSKAFLGIRYVLGALGEGPDALIDKSPLYRTDAFDCTTYVATVLALAQGNNLEDFKENLVKINYQNDHVSYLTRNHFMEVDWNYKNQYNAFLREINHLFVDEAGEPVAKMASTIIEKNNWYAKKSSSTIKTFTPLSAEEITDSMDKLHGFADVTQKETAVMLYIPLTTLFNNDGTPNKALFDQIPTAAVIEIVRPDWNIRELIGTNMNVSHMGFSIRHANELFFRDASPLTNSVRDIPLIEYLQGFLNSPSIKGIHVQKVVFPNNRQ